MDIISIYLQVGSYRGTAAICGTTPKTVKRVITRAEADSSGSAGCPVVRWRRIRPALPTPLLVEAPQEVRVVVRRPRAGAAHRRDPPGRGSRRAGTGLPWQAREEDPDQRPEHREQHDHRPATMQIYSYKLFPGTGLSI